MNPPEREGVIKLPPAEVLARWSIRNLDLLHSASGIGPEWFASHRRQALVDYAATEATKTRELMNDAALNRSPK